MDRRSFLGLAGAVVGTAALPGVRRPYPAVATPTRRRPAAPAPAFTLGVASGDPAPDGFVLWTRLVRDPAAPGGGMPGRPVEVGWEVAADEGFRRVARRGTAVAAPEWAHAVHVEAAGLAPGATYWYRFRAGGEVSPVGRARTAPPAGAPVDRVRFAVACCQNYQEGYFTAHRALAGEDVDFVVFLGDYVYESLANERTVRHHERNVEPVTLDDYRARYAHYRTDADLQAAHAAAPWVVTLDDHEVDNNWAGAAPQDPALQSRAAFRARRAAALRAYYEHMPLRRRSLPDGPSLALYRRAAWGDLLQLDVLDTRQHRARPTADAPGTMLGPAQERWLDRGLARSTARWNAVAQQTMVAENDRQAGAGDRHDADNWSGYPSARRRLLASLSRVRNPVVLTGDRHCTWVCDLPGDDRDLASAPVAAELTATSVTSGGDVGSAAFHDEYDPIMAESPHWRFIDNQRGYLLCDLDRERWLTALRVVSTVRSPRATASTRATFVTEDARPGVSLASAPTP